jgi:phosphoribosylformimino-5-aminoimidazole carboxamide ribotide isomerase
MRIIAVLDLAGGRAVHARAGARESYVPVQQLGDTPIDGDPIQLARGYIEQLGVQELYVADLDAIVHARSSAAVIREVASLPARLWLDAGVSSIRAAQDALAAGAAHAIVALETLPSFEALDSICRAVGGDRVAFSLDLHNRKPIVFAGCTAPRTGTPVDEYLSIGQIARRAADAGVAAVTVIDLARVGTSSGPDLETIAGVRAAAPDVALIAGGGVRGPDDVARLADAGCDGALVASALHDGRLTARDVVGARALHRSVSR